LSSVKVGPDATLIFRALCQNAKVGENLSRSEKFEETTGQPHMAASRLFAGRLMVLVACVCISFSSAIGRDTTSSLGLPAITYPLDNPSSREKISLGRSLFFDVRLSGDHSVSCASCHQPGRLFTDGRARAEGIRHHVGTRNTPSLVNAAFNTTQFWDGRRDTLEAQALDPLTNSHEHGLPNQAVALSYLRNDPVYAKKFLAAFGVAPSAIEMTQVAQALASFERTLTAGDSPFDRYYFNGENDAISGAAKRGLALFQGTGQCVTCHKIERDHALFSDNTFHSLRIGLDRIDSRLAFLATKLAEQTAAKAGAQPAVIEDSEIAELGRFVVTLQPIDIGRFRTPSLRNLTLTGPYMHDGSIATLENAVEYELYYRSAERGYPVVLTSLEKHDLVEFLRALTSSPASLSNLRAIDGHQ
jgi:cytochrome c peroxidase